jgi:hypothetical protein
MSRSLPLCALLLGLAAQPASAQSFMRDAPAEGYFCRGFSIFSTCQWKTVESIAKTEAGARIPFGSSFRYVDKHDAEAATCRLNNDTRWGDPQYHAYTRSASGSPRHLGVPEYFVFRCSGF